MENSRILTSDQFVAGIVATLALDGRRHFILSNTDLDEKFQKAFEDLLEAEAALKVRANFTFYVDQLHGDSVCLRDTLLAAKEKEIIALNNPTLRTFDIKLDDERAEGYLERSPLPRAFFKEVVDRHFGAMD